MKIIDKIFYWLASLIIFILSVSMIIVTFNLFGFAKDILIMPVEIYKNVRMNSEYITIEIIVELILLLISIKGLFFQEKIEKENRNAIVLENNQGKLSISRETIENLVKDVTLSQKSIELVTPKLILDKNNNLIINMNIGLKAGEELKEVVKKIQTDVKEVVKNAIDLDVKEINIDITNLTDKQIRKLDKDKKDITKEKNFIEDDQKKEKKEKNINPNTKEEKKK